jgi:hypothetical protein
MSDEVLADQSSDTECPVPTTPVPATPTLVGELAALLEILTAPLTVSACLGAKVTVSVAVWPGASVAPLIPPPETISVAATLTPEIVTLELPVFFRLTERVCTLPTSSFPKLRLVGVAVSIRVAVMPLPVIASVRLLSVALLVIVMFAVKLPVTVGANTSVPFAVAPAAKTSGVKIPLRVKAELLEDHAEIVTLAVPVFFSCTACDRLDPNGALPKLTLPGVAESVPPDDTTPVPVI